MAGPRLVLVKNTFIEVPDSQPTISFARQQSDPSPCRSQFQRGHDFVDLASLSDPDEDLAGRDPGSQESTGGSCSDAKQDDQELEVTPAKSGLEHAANNIVEFAPEPAQVQQWAQNGRRQKNGRERANGRNEERNDSRQPPEWEGATTVMMRNLANKYKQQMLLEEIAFHGFHAEKDFDFFYLPMDRNAKANLGYCFINFVEPATAWAFGQAFEGKKMRHFHSSKVVVVMPASMQGFERNYAYYATSRVAHAEDPQYRPLFFRQPAVGDRAEQSGNPGGKGKGHAIIAHRQNTARERRGKQQRGGDANNSGDGDNSRPEAHRAVGTKALYGSWGRGADNRYHDNGYGHHRSRSTHDQDWQDVQYEASPQAGVWAPENVIFAPVMVQAQQMMGMQQGSPLHFVHMQEAGKQVGCSELGDMQQSGSYTQKLDHGCGAQMVLAYMDQDAGIYGEDSQVAPR